MCAQPVEKVWYVARGGKRYGPLTFEAVVEAVANGVVHAKTNVWRLGWAEWHPAGSVPGLIQDTAADETEADLEDEVPAARSKRHRTSGRDDAYAHRRGDDAEDADDPDDEDDRHTDRPARRNHRGRADVDDTRPDSRPYPRLHSVNTRPSDPDTRALRPAVRGRPDDDAFEDPDDDGRPRGGSGKVTSLRPHLRAGGSAGRGAAITRAERLWEKRKLRVAGTRDHDDAAEVAEDPESYGRGHSPASDDWLLERENGATSRRDDFDSEDDEDDAGSAGSYRRRAPLRGPVPKAERPWEKKPASTSPDDDDPEEDDGFDARPASASHRADESLDADDEDWLLEAEDRSARPDGSGPDLAADPDVRAPTLHNQPGYSGSIALTRPFVAARDPDEPIDRSRDAGDRLRASRDRVEDGDSPSDEPETQVDGSHDSQEVILSPEFRSGRSSGGPAARRWPWAKRAAVAAAGVVLVAGAGWGIVAGGVIRLIDAPSANRKIELATMPAGDRRETAFAVATDPGALPPEVAALPAVVALQRNDPPSFNRFARRFLETGAGTEGDAQLSAVRAALRKSVKRLLANASPELLLEITRVSLGYMQALQAVSPESCVALSDESKGAKMSVNLAKDFPDLFGRDMVVLVRIAGTSPTASIPMPKPEQARPLLDKIFADLARLQLKTDLLNREQLNAAEFAPFCSLVSSFYQGILALPQADAVTLLRYLYASAITEGD